MYSDLTNERMLLILCSQSVTAREECVWVSRVKPVQVPQVHTQPHLRDRTHVRRIRG